VLKAGDAMTGPLLAANGSPTAASFAFSSDPGMGLSNSAGALAFSVGGAVKLSISAGNFNLSTNIKAVDGTISNPGIGYGLEQSGLYRKSAGNISMSVQSGEVMSWGLGGTKTTTVFGPLVLAADPTAALQAATKQYVDNKPSGSSITVSDTPPASPVAGALWWESDTGNLYIYYDDGNSSQWVLAAPQPDVGQFVQKTGDTMTGALVLPADPTTALQAATKQYVDNKPGSPDNTKVLKAGDTMTGPLVLPADPATALQAATKQYVDNKPSGAKKNYIINGAMQVSQENGATAGTPSNYYAVDQFYVGYSNAGAISFGQVASPSPAGSPNRIRLTVTTADTAVGSNDLSYIATSIEADRLADLRQGSAAAKTFVLQFGMRAPAGTYCISIQGGGTSRAYVTELVVTAGQANTDLLQSIVVPGDTAGTWPVDNSVGMNITWSVMTGSKAQTATINAWQTVTPGATYGTANQFNFMGTVGNVFELFDVSLTQGTTAPPFVVPDYVTELALCQRYWWPSNSATPKGTLAGTLAGYSITAAAIGYSTWRFPVAMRIPPALSIWNNGVQGQVRNTSNGSVMTTGGVTGSYLQQQGGCIIQVSAITINVWIDFDLQANARM
jgi:hypothetical protein